MVLRRVFFAFNVFMAVLIPLVLGLGYWFLWRPSPQTSGVLDAPVGAAVSIVRDARGMAHITAASLDDAFFAQGFATAQDRLWQMDMMRRFNSGHLAEVLGQPGVESDIKSRRLGLARLADTFLRSMPAEDRAMLAAFARGVNAFLALRRFPPECALLGYEPRPWRPADSVLAGLHMHRMMTLRWEREMESSRLFQDGDRAKLPLLFPARSGGEIAPGSNAWVMSGAWTASGKPLLANDPHLEWNMPAIWHQVHLRAPGLHVAGATVPGLPGVAIGHNERIAWGITSLEYDEMDLFEEKIDLRSGIYFVDGKPLQARREVEFVAVRGAPPLELAGWSTHRGPVFLNDGPRQFSLAWSATLPGGFSLPILALDRAANWQEFRQVLSRFPGPGFNFVYADVDGNIGYQAAGRLPLRKADPGPLPLDGSTSANDWQGAIPFDDLPRAYNPPSGIIVSSNQNPFPPDTRYVVAGHFSAPYRQRQIDARLRSRKGWQPAELLSVQTDVYSALHDYLARTAVATTEKSMAQNPSLTAAVQVLKGWNGQMDAASAAPFLATIYYQHLRRTLAERVSPKHGADYTTEMAPAAVENLLRARPAGWFPDWDKMQMEALADAYDEAARMQGRNAAKWRYGLYNEVTIAHPIAGRIPWAGPWLARYFNAGPVQLSGSSTTVKQTTRKLGPSMRFIADLSGWDQSLLNITSGQMAHILSWHYMDQWDAYLSGTSFPLPFTRVEGSTLTLRPRR